MEVGVALATDQWAPRVQIVRGVRAAVRDVHGRRGPRPQPADPPRVPASLEDRAARLERERDQQAQLAVGGGARPDRPRDARHRHAQPVGDGRADRRRRVHRSPASPDAAADAVGKASEIGRQAIAEMRRRPGGAARRATPSHATGTRSRACASSTGCSPRYARPGSRWSSPSPASRRPLAPGAELAVYRIVQEALTNILKHAARGRPRARVRLGTPPTASTSRSPTTAGRAARPRPTERPGTASPACANASRCTAAR